MYERTAAGLEQVVQLPEVAVLGVQVEMEEDVERVGEPELDAEARGERRVLQEHEPDVGVMRERLACTAQHAARDVESPELSHAGRHTRGDTATANADLGDPRVALEVGIDEVLEDALDVLRRAPLVADDADVLPAPLGRFVLR